MYVADVNQVYYCYPDESGTWELFLTVHPGNYATLPEQQAVEIARLLNENKVDAAS
jgi:hypothetical protein